MQKSLLQTILKSGLIVGAADLVLACISAYAGNGTTPDRVLKYIAGGAFGKAAFSGGAGMVVAGLVFHFFIALTFTALFFYLYPKIRLLRINKIATGIAYGVFVWTVMNRLVLPLTQLPQGAFSWSKAALAAGILIVAIGLPLAWLAEKYYDKEV